MKLEDMQKLAQMARIDISDDELANIAHDFDSILSYVGQVQEVSEMSDIKPDYILLNVMREDIVTNPAGSYTDKIIAQMPDTQDGFLKVKQIL